MTTSKTSSKKIDSGRIHDIDWNIIVKQTFIEVVIPPSQEGGRRRAMSDSGLSLFEKVETTWKSITSDKHHDVSDASTNGDLDSCNGGSTPIDEASMSSDGENEVQQQSSMMPYYPSQCFESWWMPVGFAADGSSVCYDMM